MVRAFVLTAACAVCFVAVVACGGSAEPDSYVQPDASSPGGSSSGGSSSGTTARVPKMHRAAAAACDGTLRPDDAGHGAPISCQPGKAECPEGSRCRGELHSGWYCTYDLCKSDGECGATGVCRCDQSFGADADVCLQAGCRIDGDCGAQGYCSPSSLGCGVDSEVITYACHQPTDECVDDEDCAALLNGACRFDPTVNHWTCSSTGGCPG